LEAYLSYLIHCCRDEVNEMLTPKHRAVAICGSLSQQLFDCIEMMENLGNSQLLNSFGKVFFVIQEFVKANKYLIDIGVGWLETK
jgi:hypothetical protein